MPLISESFADDLIERNMRTAYLRAQLRTRLAQQIRALRLQRDWSQGDFADALHTSQSTASRYESIDYGKWTFSTLIEMAAAFDVGLVLEFVPYEEFLTRTAKQDPASLEVESFDRQALEPLCAETTTISVPHVTSARRAVLNDRQRSAPQPKILSITVAAPPRLGVTSAQSVSNSSPRGIFGMQA